MLYLLQKITHILHDAGKFFSGPFVTRQEGKKRLKPHGTQWALVPNLQATTRLSQLRILPTETQILCAWGTTYQACFCVPPEYNIKNGIYLSTYGSTALCWALAAFSVS
jgi:hypothetical protein